MSVKVSRNIGWLGSAYPALQATPPGVPVTQLSWTGSSIPSQVTMGPGSKPSAQAHSKPPMTLVHVPSPQGCPTEHSSVSG
jgi:hypothetical protein